MRSGAKRLLVSMLPSKLVMSA